MPHLNSTTSCSHLHICTCPALEEILSNLPIPQICTCVLWFQQIHFYIFTFALSPPHVCAQYVLMNERTNIFFTFSFTLHSGHSSEHFNEFDSADYSWWSACTMAWLLHTEHMNILPWAPIPHHTIPRHTTLDQNLLTSPDYNLGCQGMVFFIACRLKCSLLLFPSCFSWKLYNLYFLYAFAYVFVFAILISELGIFV